MKEAKQRKQTEKLGGCPWTTCRTRVTLTFDLPETRCVYKTLMPLKHPSFEKHDPDI